MLGPRRRNTFDWYEHMGGMYLDQVYGMLTKYVFCDMDKSYCATSRMVDKSAILHIPLCKYH